MFAVRRRRGRQADEQQDSYGKALSSRAWRKGLGTTLAFFLLVVARLTSAVFNIVHDCDEVYNYWEPLHYLLYGYGMQTWEYSSEFSLRSYLYLLLHAPVAALSALLAGPGAGKVYVFYSTKAFLGMVSACAETALYRATRDHAGAATGHYLLVLLVFSSGMFAAASSMLPSTFAMYTVTWAAAGVLRGRPPQVIVAAVACVIWGWPVAGVALLPYALYVLFSRSLLRSVSTLTAALMATVVPLAVADRLFYGKWTVSLWNFIRYNVIGGGDSALYGVECPTFYIHNGALNLNIALPLALAAPAVLFFWSSRQSGSGRQWRLLVALSPVWVWLAAISALPHKEERFLYVVYPLVCLGAAAVLAAMRPMIFKATAGMLPRRVSSHLAVLVPYSLVALFAVLSLARGLALLNNYSAPMRLYRHLPEIPMEQQGPGQERYVCVGDEWHRFPSSFFLPSPGYRLAFLKSGFTGLLPRAFSFEEGGTAAASPFLNDRNREEPANYWTDASRCNYLVELRRPGSPSREGPWEQRASLPFILNSESPSSLARALHIPWYSSWKNYQAEYVLYQRAAPDWEEPRVLEQLSTAASTRGRPF